MHRFALRTGKQTFALGPGVYRIGREPSSDIRLDDVSVSRAHATLRVDEERVLLEERGSRNGIRVNGALERGRIHLHEGDRVQIGTVELELVHQDPSIGESGGSLPTQPLPKLARASEPPAQSVLSGREQQVLAQIASGLTQREIAERLGVSVKTVETYRARVAEKLGLASRAEFVAHALSIGLLPVRARPSSPPARRDPD